MRPFALGVLFPVLGVETLSNVTLGASVRGLIATLETEVDFLGMIWPFS